jgi:hypothetical protein
MMTVAEPPSVTMPWVICPRQLLAQQPDRHLGDGHRVGGVDAEVRRDGGVRLGGRCR